MMASSKMRLSTFNCKHFKVDRLDYVKQVFAQCDFLFLQEHCLFQSNLDKLSHICSDTAYCAVSGMDEHKLLSGRPYGGCAIVWRSSLDITVTKLKCVSNRLCYSY
jgi:hypothetical protein